MQQITLFYAIKSTTGALHGKYYGGPAKARLWDSLNGALFYQNIGRAQSTLDRLRQLDGFGKSSLKIVPIVCLEVVEE